MPLSPEERELERQRLALEAWRVEVEEKKAREGFWTLPRRLVLLLSFALAFLVVAGAHGGADQATQTEVRIHIVVPKDPGGSPVGAVNATPDLTEKDSCQTVDIPCTLRYYAPTRVTLTALVTNSAYRFHNWTAVECPSGQSECVLDLTGEDPDVSVFPLYDPAHIDVAVAGPDTTGTVTWPGGQCTEGQVDPCITGPLSVGQPVLFKAEKEGHPINWAFGCDPRPENVCEAYPENRILGVGFDGAQPFPPFEVKAWLRVGRTGPGTGRVTGSEFDCGSGDGCRKLIDFGKLVTLRADAAAGSRFDGWVGVCGASPTCRFSVGPVTSVKARFVEAPAPPPPPPSPPPPPKLQVGITKLTGFRRAGRWHVTARISSNKAVSARALVGRKRRTWGNRAGNLRAGSSSLTVRLARRATRGRCWFRFTARTAEGEIKVLPQRVVRLGR
jgi:hypothetical protein